MERKIKKALVVLFVSLTVTTTARAAGKNTEKFDWGRVMDAIIMVESNGDAHAVRGTQCGAMQITPIMVRECNIILKKQNKKKRFTLDDRFSIAKSKEMFLLFQSYHNPTNNVEKAIRSWNGGLNYSVKRTERYYKKVLKAMK